MKADENETNGSEPFIITVVGVITGYLICSTIEWNFDPGLWKIGMRLIWVLWVIFFTVLLLIIWTNELKNNKKD